MFCIKATNRFIILNEEREYRARNKEGGILNKEREYRARNKEGGILNKEQEILNVFYSSLLLPCSLLDILLALFYIPSTTKKYIVYQTVLANESLGWYHQ